MGFVAYTRFCRESGFVVNTRFFGFVLSRLLLRHKGFYSDFVQISAQKIGGWDLCSRGHDNVHDDMNMYVIMHDQCLFIAMINIFHIWSIALHSMNGTFMHESAWSMIITINVHSLGYDHWSLTIRVIKFHVWTCCSWGYDHWTEDEKPPLPCSTCPLIGENVWFWNELNGDKLFFFFSPVFIASWTTYSYMKFYDTYS